ncbi:MAG: Gfo/Idh/MocA family oxidoreductase [Lachnospiraceae bacterium]|jgi:predicted dehydrogenase|nr:Gfo/Idh/MocA family oxidoreductase [Lachnospiraceae bacterium]
MKWTLHNNQLEHFIQNGDRGDMSKLRLGIIGIGNMGSGHCKSIIEGKCPEIELSAVCDINPVRLDWVKEIAPSAICYDDAIKMMDSGLIDAVLIAVPHYEHVPLAIQAFEHGLHVLCEKPAGVYTKQVRDMNKAADASGKVFGLMYNQRTDHIYRKMHEIVQSGELGAIRRTNWIITDWYRPQAYYNSGGWRATWSGEGGGVLLNQSPHQLDLWQWICGLPVTVRAEMSFGKWHDIEVEDDVTAFVTYENGATGTIITTTGDFPGSNRFEITLDGGKLLAENGKLTMWRLSKTITEFDKSNDIAFGHPDVETIAVQTDGKSEQHIGVMNAFAGAILHGTPLIADGRDGINGLMLSNAMHLSAWQDKVVKLPLCAEDEEAFYEELMKRSATVMG